MKNKRITKADLELQIKELEKSIEIRDEKIELLQKDVVREQDWSKHILATLTATLDCMHLLPLPNINNRPLHTETKKPSLSEIQFKIGQLLVYTQEYVELKDRTLPLPKSKTLEDEHRRENRNGGGFPGIIGIGRG